jgi:hypothetical protein
VVNYRDQETRGRPIALFGDARASDCFAEVHEATLAATTIPPGAGVGTPLVTVTPGSGRGPSSIVATATVRLAARHPTGQAMPFALQYVFLAGRSAEAVLLVASAGTPLAPDVRSAVTDAVARRVAAL